MAKVSIVSYGNAQSPDGMSEVQFGPDVRDADVSVTIKDIKTVEDAQGIEEDFPNYAQKYMDERGLRRIRSYSALAAKWLPTTQYSGKVVEG
jgi:hypothetical protein